jgi:hypothetical protein
MTSGKVAPPSMSGRVTARRSPFLILAAVAIVISAAVAAAAGGNARGMRCSAGRRYSAVFFTAWLIARKRLILSRLSVIKLIFAIADAGD